MIKRQKQHKRIANILHLNYKYILNSESDFFFSKQTVFPCNVSTTLKTKLHKVDRSFHQVAMKHFTHEVL